jgi:acetyl-CoA carboxylase, biotin carboxylase subunit
LLLSDTDWRSGDWRSGDWRSGDWRSGDWRSGDSRQALGRGGGVTGRVLRRVLVANRGEIAVRVIRTCRRLGIETVLTVSDADAGSLPARLADRVIPIGPGPAGASYLSVDAVVRAAVTTGADAVHPGYGFLSENARLARACAAAGIVFIGPTPETLEAAGDKLAAREHAVAAGLPVLPGGHVTPEAASLGDGRPGVASGDRGGGDPGGAGGYHGGGDPGGAGGYHGGGDPGGAGGYHGGGDDAGDGRDGRDGDAAALAGRIGYPVLVKAAGGGGGRGLRVVRDPAGLTAAVALASAEAGAAFGDPRVYLERYVERGRHVEVQLLGDGEHVIHLGDRDCSVQRRYQKLIEEAPAPGLGDGLRERLRAAAVALGEHLRYRGAGTVEFLVNADSAGADDGEFYFLEVNARIQVEHPVTEAVTGIDIVAEQLAIAEGRPLRLKQADVRFDGHAIEVRLNAEDPAHDFRPSPGTITRAVFPVSTLRAGTSPARDAAGEAGTGVRVDTHLQAGVTVPPYYDSLLAKVIGLGSDRDSALRTLRGALGRCSVDGIITNLELHRALLADAEFTAGGVDTGYLARWLAGAAAESGSGSDG